MITLLTGAIIGAVLVLLGVAAGLAWGITREVTHERRRRWEAERAARKPQCGCGHHYAFHDVPVARRGQGGTTAGACHHENWRDPYGRQGVRCGCQQYVGFQPEQIEGA